MLTSEGGSKPQVLTLVCATHQLVYTEGAENPQHLNSQCDRDGVCSNLPPVCAELLGAVSYGLAHNSHVLTPCAVHRKRRKTMVGRKRKITCVRSGPFTTTGSIWSTIVYFVRIRNQARLSVVDVVSRGTSGRGVGRLIQPNY